MSRFDDPADDRRTPFDERLAELLGRTAQSARPNPDLARQVRQRLSAGDAPGRAPRSFATRYPWLAPVGSAAVVAILLLAFVAVLFDRGIGNFRPGGGAGATPTPQATSARAQACGTPNPQAPPTHPNPSLLPHPADHSVAVGASATDHGITITLDRAYADATQTVATFSVSPDGTYTIGTAILLDASGARYQSQAGGSIRLPNTHYLNMLVFTPLPQSALGMPQHLTVSFTQLVNTASGGEGQASPMLSGIWLIPFTITPVAGTPIPLSLPAQTHNGVTIQLEEMDVAPAGGGLDGQSGGVRVRFRVSGLPPTAPLRLVTQYPTSFMYTLASGGGSSGGGPGPGGPECANTLTLMLANGQPLTPGFIITAGMIVPVSASEFKQWMAQTVGPNGAIEVEALFFAPIPAGKTSFAINTVTLSEMRAGKQVFLRNAQGPWAFTVTLSK